MKNIYGDTDLYYWKVSVVVVTMDMKLHTTG